MHHGWRKNVSCNGNQICKNCWTHRIPRKSISRALERVAATQAKVAATAAEEKKALVIADVRAAIAEKKRTRDADGAQTQRAEPKAKQRREKGKAEVTIANAQDPITEQKPRREVDEAAAQEGEPKEKQRKDETRKAEESHKALKASTRQEGNKASKEKTLPANAGHAKQRGQSFEYVCPACHQSVISSIRTASKSSPDMREPIPSEQRCCGNEICCLHMSILQGACEQQCEDRENQPSGCLWVQIFRTGRRCRKEKVCLPVPILQWTCEQQREDRANQPSICVQQSILRQGR